MKLPWSYPDYMSDTAIDFLTKARQKLSQKLKQEALPKRL
jgi:hypothetical protein